MTKTEKEVWKCRIEYLKIEKNRLSIELALSCKKKLSFLYKLFNENVLTLSKPPLRTDWTLYLPLHTKTHVICLWVIYSVYVMVLLPM